jgi:XTP/dITP diphosphohydrolase
MNGMKKKLHTLFLASGNPDKIRELKDLLEPLGCVLKSVSDVSGNNDVKEDQETLKGNALKKARYWHLKTGLPALADDTGLEVDALDGAPGVYSARYAGESVTYRDNVNKLLEEMRDKTNRAARFRTVIALAGDEEIFFEGVCEGEITKKPEGDSGFGYDPVFRPEGYEKTFAELRRDEKNRISHRGKALKKLVDYLRDGGENHELR